MTPYQRFLKIKDQINRLDHFSLEYKDCMIMLHNLERIHRELDKESVECRRLHRETTHYEVLLQRFDEAAKNVEHFLLMARLLN